MSDHLPARDFWDCSACGQTWPCAPAKEALLEEFAGKPSALVAYLGLLLAEATEDLSAHWAPPPVDLHERFLGWLRPLPQTLPR